MHIKTRKWLSFQSIAALFCLVGLFFAYRAWDKHEMLRVTLLWGRLAPLPASAQDFTITKEGGMFTRAFRVSFSAPLVDVERWLRESPGTNEVTPVKYSQHIRQFLVSPGNGAQHSEVNFDDISGVVRIYVYWS